MLAHRIKTIAKEQGMKMSDIANAMHINPINLSASINGNPTVATLQKIADVLHVDIAEFFQSENKDTTAQVNGYIEINGKITKIKCRQDIVNVLDMLTE